MLARDPRRALPALAALAGALLLGYGLLTRHGPALADEYVYLAGAKHLARTGSLDARFYDAQAVLLGGIPQQDVHDPGYVLLLGALTAVVRGGYWTAVALNVVAYLAGAWLVHRLARELAFGERTAWVAAALYLVLPAYLPFVFWVLPEVILGTLLLAGLVLAVRGGDRAWGAVLAALAVGLGLLVRESMAFGLPAVVAVLWRRGRLRAFAATLVVFVALVQLPLSRHRAPGGVNFWDAPTDGPRRGGFAVVHAARRGDLPAMLGYAWARVRGNARLLGHTGASELAILALFVLIPAWALLGRRSGGLLARRCLLGLIAGWAGLLASLVVLFVVGRWSGLRYLAFFMPPLLPWAARTVDEPRAARARWAVPAALAAACLTLDAQVLRVHNAYKASRQTRQEGISSYLERAIGTRPITRVAVPNGWRFGLEHYPVEVISSLPQTSRELRLLERAVWFDYLVLAADSPLAGEWDARPGRYLRVNLGDPTAQLNVYRRLR